MKFDFFPIKRFLQVVFLVMFAVFFTFEANAGFEENNKRKISKKELDALYRICGGRSEVSYFEIAALKKYPPFSWKVVNEKTAQKKYEGFVPEAVHKALNDIGIYKIHERFYDTTEEMFQDAMLGRIDIIFTAFYDAKTSKVLDLIFPAYFGNPIGLISRKSDVVHADQLSGKIGAIISSEGLNLMISGILPSDAKLIEVEDFNEAYTKLLSGEIDFIAAGKYAAMSEALALGIKDRVSIPDENFKANKIFAGFTKVSSCHYFKKMFEDAFKKYFDDKDASRDRMRKAIEDWAEYKKASGDLVEMPPDPAKVEEEQKTLETAEQAENAEQQESAGEEQGRSIFDPAPVEKQPEPSAEKTAEEKAVAPEPVKLRNINAEPKAETTAPTSTVPAVPTTPVRRPPVFKQPVENTTK